MSEERANGDNLHRLVLRLYQARETAKAARKARAAAREKAGDCEHSGYPEQGPCWLAKPETWCEACAAVMPYYAAYHAASDKAGAALRLVLREGKRMSQNDCREGSKEADRGNDA